MRARFAILRVLLEAGAPPDQARDDGATPLYKACQDGGRLDIAKLLLKNGAKTDQVDAAGMWISLLRSPESKTGPVCRSPAPPCTSRWTRPATLG